MKSQSWTSHGPVQEVPREKHSLRLTRYTFTKPTGQSSSLKSFLPLILMRRSQTGLELRFTTEPVVNTTKPFCVRCHLLSAFVYSHPCDYVHVTHIVCVPPVFVYVYTKSVFVSTCTLFNRVLVMLLSSFYCLCVSA